MFAILQISECNTIFRRPKIKSKRINLPSDDAFFIVTVDKHLGKIPWKKLEKCLGILKHDILLPEDINIPEEINITPFTSDTLQRIMLINSATDCILKDKSHFTSKSLAVYDEKNIYADYIEKLIPCFRSIKIITPTPKKYDPVQNKLLETYGFSLIVTSEEKYDIDVVISHHCTVPLYFGGKVFTNEKKYLMNAEVFSGSAVDLPEEYENLKPANIEAALFASALYENCNVKEIDELRYSDFSS